MKQILNYLGFLALVLSIVFFSSYSFAEEEVSKERIEFELAQGERVNNALMLANVMICEASVEGRVGMLAVADVVLNRVNHPRFPDTIEGVIYQRHQFECIQKGKNYGFNDYGFREVYLLALDKLDGKTPRITKATHYYQHVAMPKPPFWAKREHFLGKIGNHSFFYPYP